MNLFTPVGMSHSSLSQHHGGRFTKNREKTEVCTTIIHTLASVCVTVCVEPHGLRPPTVKVDECVTARVQPNWSGNIVACVGGAASAAVAADCGGTCWFTRDKQRDWGWVGGKRKMKHDFLFSQQQHPDFQAAVLFFFSRSAQSFV